MLAPSFLRRSCMPSLRPLLLMLALPLACAQSLPAPPVRDGEGEPSMARVEALRKEAGDRQRAADQGWAAEKAACHSRFLVSGCLEGVDKNHRRELEAVRELNVQANGIERALRTRERVSKASGRPSGAARQAEAADRRQWQAQKLEDFERRQESRDARMQAGAGREAELQHRIRLSEAGREEQLRRNGEARQRAETARQKTAASLQARQEARRREEEAGARRKAGGG